MKNTGYIYAVRCVNRLIYSAYEDPERYMNTQCAEEGMNYEKLISILLCGMLMLTMLAACAKTETSTDAAADTAPQTENAAEQSGDAAAAQTTIVWQSWDSYSKYEAAILAFEQAHPEIHVEYEQVSDYMTKS